MTRNLIKFPWVVFIQLTYYTPLSFALWYDLFATYSCFLCLSELFLMLTINLRAKIPRVMTIKVGKHKTDAVSRARGQRLLHIKNVNLILKPSQGGEWLELAAKAGIGGPGKGQGPHTRTTIMPNPDGSFAEQTFRIKCQMPCPASMCGCGRKANDCSQSYKLTTM